MMISRRLRLLLLTALMPLLLPTPAQARAGEPDAFRLQLKWVPQAQFMGFYVAQARGYYEREGLDVQFLSGGPGVTPLDVVGSGRADAVVEWMPTVLAARERGLRMVNVAQFLQRSGLTLTCRKDRGVHKPTDVRGKRVSVWGEGNEVPFHSWMDSLRIDTSGKNAAVEVVGQGYGVSAYLDEEVDCLSAMTYNEYWQLLHGGARVANMTIFSYEDLGFSLLEDGLYVEASRLDEASFRDRLVRFVRASIDGWRYAVENTVESALVVSEYSPSSDVLHQTRMAEEIARLTGDPERIGLLDLASLDRTIDLLEESGTHPVPAPGELSDTWSHEIWHAATGEPPGAFSLETKYRLSQVLTHSWFYALDLVGTIAFGIAGFMRARERRYDLWGAFILTFLPAVGGGTLRDLLVGGDRHPPFIFKDPTYIYVVLSIVFVGWILARHVRFPAFLRVQFDRIMFVTDTIGMAAFTIIGAKVAILAGLAWFWIPICGALTCAGGGVLLDVVTGREPRTFRGEFYEEIAIVGGLVLLGLLHFASDVPAVTIYVVVSICTTMGIVFALRTLVVVKKLRAPLLR